MGERTNGLSKRRGLLTGAAVLASGVATLTRAGRVEAAHGSPDATTALHVGVTNSGTQTTTLTTTPGTPTRPGLVSVVAVGTNAPVQNRSDKADAVQGYAQADGSVAVYGRNRADPTESACSGPT